MRNKSLTVISDRPCPTWSTALRENCQIRHQEIIGRISKVSVNRCDFTDSIQNKRLFKLPVVCVVATTNTFIRRVDQRRGMVVESDDGSDVFLSAFQFFSFGSPYDLVFSPGGTDKIRHF